MSVPIYVHVRVQERVESVDSSELRLDDVSGAERAGEDSARYLRR